MMYNNTSSQQPDYDAMNRDKVSSILQYLDDVDNESCASSSVVAPYQHQYQNQNQNQTMTMMMKLMPQQQAREPSLPHTANNNQQLSPSPMNPHFQQQQQYQDPMVASFHQQQEARSLSASYGRQESQPYNHHQQHQHQQMMMMGAASLSPSAQSSVSQQYQNHLHQHQQQQHVLAPNNTRSSIISVSVPRSTAEGSIISGAATTANAQYNNLRRKVNSIVTDRDNAAKQVETLKQQLQVAEERERAKVSQIREQVEEETARARKQMQSAVDEHLRCIRKLLAEKENLIKRVEDLQTEVTGAASKRDGEVKRLRDLHDKSLHDLRNRLAAQERAKRDEWAQKEAKRIKESTMKAMEPDIALLLNRHKAEKKRLEEELADAVQKREQVNAAKEREVAEFKSKLVRDMDEASQREREAARAQAQDQTERLVRMLEEERRMHEERRRGLESNHEEVRHSLVEQVADMARRLADAERREQQRMCNSSSEVADAVGRAQKEMGEQHKQMRDSLEKERASLAESVRKASEQLLEARAAEIRQQCQHERDAAIAKVVAKLEQEQLKSIQEARESEKRWKDVNGQLQREADRLRTELDCTAAHFRSAKEAVTERDERLRRLQEQVVELKHVANADSAATEDAFERRMAALDAAWQQRMQAMQAEHVRNTSSLNAEVQHLKRQFDLQRDEHSTAASVSAQKHAAELAVINERVALTLNRKDAQLRQMADTISNLERHVQMRDEELARHDALLNGDDVMIVLSSLIPLSHDI